MERKVEFLEAMIITYLSIDAVSKAKKHPKYIEESLGNAMAIASETIAKLVKDHPEMEALADKTLEKLSKAIEASNG